MSIRRIPAVFLVLCGLVLPGTAAAAVGQVTEFSRGISPGATPQGIAKGPDGNLWFTESAGNRIGRIAPGGQVTEFSAGLSAGAQPWSVAAGPDGNVWFTELAGGRVGRITPTGQITEFALPTANAQPWGITSGPDGNLWVTYSTSDANVIARVTPQGAVTEFVYALGAATIPTAITAGSDGNLWFVESATSNIAKMTTAGQLLQSFDQIPENSGLAGIAAGPDGNLWFTMSSANAVGRLTTAGVYTGFGIATASEAPTSITAGPDGALWVTEYGSGGLGNDILRVTTAGAMTQYQNGISANAGVWGIAPGPDGNVWFTETRTNRIGRILTGAVPANTAVPTITGALAVGATLTAVPGTWTNLPTGYAYAWFRCTQAVGGTCQTVPQQTKATYRLTAADQGRFLKVGVTASNLNGASARVPSADTGQVPTSAFTLSATRVTYQARAVLLTTYVTIRFPGRIVQSATTRTDGRTVRRCLISRVATYAGTWKVQCRMQSATRALLKRQSLRATVTTTFTATGAVAQTQTRTLDLRRRS